MQQKVEPRQKHYRIHNESRPRKGVWGFCSTVQEQFAAMTLFMVINLRYCLVIGKKR